MATLFTMFFALLGIILIAAQAPALLIGASMTIALIITWIAIGNQRQS